MNNKFDYERDYNKENNDTKIKISLMLSILNLFVLIFVIMIVKFQGGIDDRANIVDEVAFKYINIIENEGYLSELTKSNIQMELIEFDSVEVTGTDIKVHPGQSVNLKITVKDKGSFFKKEKDINKEIFLNGQAR